MLRLAQFHPKEIQGYNKQGGMEESKRNKVPANRRLIVSKLIFKKVRDVQ